MAERLTEKTMHHYIAIIEEGDANHATGVWFPDLPGCFSAGDTLDEAIMNAREALALWASSITEDGGTIPSARSLAELKTDPEIASDIDRCIVAAVPLLPDQILSAAE